MRVFGSEQSGKDLNNKQNDIAINTSADLLCEFKANV